MRKILFSVSLLLLILIVSCTQQDISGDTTTPQTVTGRVVTSIEEPSDSGTDYNVCNNAQTYESCDKLNTAFKAEYKEYILSLDNSL